MMAVLMGILAGQFRIWDEKAFDDHGFSSETWFCTYYRSFIVHSLA